MKKQKEEQPANFSFQLSCLAKHNISCLARITGPLTCLTKTCPAWQDVARATNCGHGGNEVPEPMFSKIIRRHGDKCPAWREKVVWGKWMMTWQKPTGKES